MASNAGSDRNGRVVNGTVAEFKSFIDGKLGGEDSEFLLPHVAFVDDPDQVRTLNRLYAAWEEMETGHSTFYEIPRVRRIMRNIAGIEAAEALAKGNVSKIRGMIGDTRSSENYQTAIGHILEEMGKEAYTGMILADPNAPGAQNVGKTDFGLNLVMNYQANIGGEVATNIPVNQGQGIQQIETETEMKEWAADAENPLMLLDEVDQFLSAKHGDKDKVSRMASWIREIRKEPWLARIVLIGHVEKGVEPDIRQMVNHVLAKRAKKVLVIYSTHADMAKGNDKMVLRDVPPTPIRYKEHRQPVFSFDDQEAGDDRPEAEQIAEEFIEDYRAGEEDARHTIRESKRPQDDGKMIVDKSRLETYYNLSTGMAKSVKVIVEDRLL